MTEQNQSQGSISLVPHGTIESRLGENVFRIYEPHITRAVESWPEETEFKPDSFKNLSGKALSGNTFSARMRDAITSVIRFGWTTTIDVEKLRAMVGRFAVSMDSTTGSVWWRNKAKRGRPNLSTQEIRSAGYAIDADVTRIPWKDPTKEEIHAVCILLVGGRVTGPIILEGSVEHAFTTALEQQYPVFFTWDPTHNKTIITV